jgi:ssDNA-binding Zn-finger/Zn-ribbon topoisomerase 1
MVKKSRILGWDAEFLCPKCHNPMIKVEKRNGNFWWACLDCKYRLESGKFVHPQPDTEWQRQREYLGKWAKNHPIIGQTKKKEK